MMNKKFVKVLLIIFFVLALCGIGNRLYQLAALGKNGFQTFLQVLETLKTSYVKKNLDETKLFYGAIRGLLYSLDDPYTRFLDPKAYSEMQVRMKGTFGGIGIQIGMKDNILTVITPMENTPAWKAGLMSLDQILAIDEEPTFDLSMEEAVQKIRGARGTKVKLKIMRKSFKKPKDFEIVRDIITIEDVKSSMYNGQTGYIKLITFENEKTTVDLVRTINDLKKQGLSNLILDLRNNGGGLLQNALEISSLFIEKGQPIVATVDREGHKETFYSEGGYIGRYPLVVLVNEASASASEILAGAIQDNKMGTLVGEKSFGKASVQTIKPLWDGSALLYTVAKYLTPSGRDITEKGVAPDVVVKSNNEDSSAELDNRLVVPTWPPDPKKDPVLQKAFDLLRGKNSAAVKNRQAFLDTSGYLPYIKLNFLINNC